MTIRLWNRNFTLLIMGQLISIFGNMILSFALPLYILHISGSASLFGIVLGLTYIPLLITSPIGGMIADRFKKQRIMFWLDAATTVLIVVYIAASGLVTAILPIVIVKLMALNAIQGVYMPTVSASVPVLVHEEKLVSANAVVNLINSLSQMAGMAIAGILFAAFGLLPILVISGICFAITAVMDLLIDIPFKPQDNSGGIVKIVKGDLSQAVKFMKEKTIIAKSAALAFLITITLLSMMMVGIPVLVTQHLDMGMEFVGISQGVVMAGGLIGGFLAGILGSKLKISHIDVIFVLSGLILVPVGVALWLNIPYFAIYIIITAACAIAMVLLIMGNVQIVSLIQKETPVELIGKVISIVVMLPFLANAAGQFIYGIAFEYLAEMPYIVVFITAVMVVAIGFYARKIFNTADQSDSYPDRETVSHIPQTS